MQVLLDSPPLSLRTRIPPLPTTEYFQRHEVLANNGRNQDTILFRDDLFSFAAFGIQEQGPIAI